MLSPLFQSEFGQSPPVRGRGLKLAVCSRSEPSTSVAPRAGAWIETFLLFKYKLTFLVAPRAGAWIETIVIIALALAKTGRPPCGGVD